MIPDILFPFADYWWLYGVFTLGVVAVLALDLGIFNRRAHVVTLREAAVWSCVWVALGLLVGLGLWQYAHWRLPQIIADGGLAAQAADRVGLEYLAGYVVEKALAVDNVFVIAMVMSYFAVPAELRHRVLFYGIIGAIVFRALFIALGAVLLQYQWVVWIAGGFLVLTGIKMMLVGQQAPDPERNPMVRLVRTLVAVTPDFRGQAFVIRESGRWLVTPLFIALVMIEVGDVIFAIDSVPAIFALTKEPLIVFTSNIAAILGLRAMYFLLDGVMERFHLLKYGLALILIFVGLKMAWLNDAFGGKFPIVWSLGIIAMILTISIVASLLRPVSTGAKPLASVPEA